MSGHHECLTLRCLPIPIRAVKLVDAGHMLAIYSERFFDSVVREGIENQLELLLLWI